jgi:hypothetical protein
VIGRPSGGGAPFRFGVGAVVGDCLIRAPRRAFEVLEVVFLFENRFD